MPLSVTGVRISVRMSKCDKFYQALWGVKHSLERRHMNASPFTSSQDHFGWKSTLSTRGHCFIIQRMKALVKGGSKQCSDQIFSPSHPNLNKVPENYHKPPSLFGWIANVFFCEDNVSFYLEVVLITARDRHAWRTWGLNGQPLLDPLLVLVDQGWMAGDGSMLPQWPSWIQWEALGFAQIGPVTVSMKNTASSQLLWILWIPPKFFLGHFSISPLLEFWPHCSLYFPGVEGRCLLLTACTQVQHLMLGVKWFAPPPAFVWSPSFHF